MRRAALAIPAALVAILFIAVPLFAQTFTSVVYVPMVMVCLYLPLPFVQWTRC